MYEQRAAVGTTFDVTILEDGKPAIAVNLEQSFDNVVSISVYEFGDLDYPGLHQLLQVVTHAIDHHYAGKEQEQNNGEFTPSEEITDKNDDIPF